MGKRWTLWSTRAPIAILALFAFLFVHVSGTSAQSNSQSLEGFPVVRSGNGSEPEIDKLPGSIDRGFGSLSTAELDYFSKVALSTAGYPVGRIRRPVAACTNPYKTKDAAEAFRSGDRRWMSSLVNCYVMAEGLVVEWVKMRDPYHLDQTPVRLRSVDGGKMTLYTATIYDGTLVESPLDLIAR